MGKHPIRGVYAIIDTEVVPDDALSQTANAIINNGVSVIQYRAKAVGTAQKLKQAGTLADLCRRAEIPLIINDDIALCLSVEATGVHLGRDDQTLTEARKRLGPDKIIGISCYNQLNQAIAAQQMGADYVAFGSVFSSSTKPNAVNAPLELLKQAKQQLEVPVVAIGGITINNIKRVIETGVDAAAIIRGLFAEPNPGIIARQIADLFRESEKSHE